jgi:hypothetical protein
MKRLFYLIGIAGLLLLTQGLYSQQVISAGGASATSTTAQLSWTIGEPVIETYTGTGIVLTQGFHQSRLVVTAAGQISLPGILLSVYPNPVTDDLLLNITGDRVDNFGYSLYDFSGKILLSAKPAKQPEVIGMGNFPAGIYLLKVTGKNESSQTFKIVKTDL